MKETHQAQIERLAKELSPVGRHSVTYIESEHHADRPLTLNTYRPAGYTPDRPVVLVQHGVLRNGDEYRDFWIPAADKHQLLIVAPTFSNEHWPGVESYNNGRALTPTGEVRPVESWTYAILAKIFDDLRRAGVTEVEQAHLFGHSAGGQFVHRLMSSQAHESFCAAAAGNPGWYTLPTMMHPFPEGLGGAGLDDGQLEELLAYPLMILAGDQDISTTDPNLPSDPAALRQGPHRFARAQNYFEAGRQEAARRGVPFHWTFHRVPGVGHDGRTMSAACASLWFEGQLPSDEALAAMVSQHVA